MDLDHLAAAAARAPFLPHRIVFEDALLDVAHVGGKWIEAGCGPVRLAGLAQPAVLELVDLIEIDPRDAEPLADLRHDGADMLPPIARGAKPHRRIGDEKGGIGDVAFAHHQPLLSSAVANM